MVVNCFFEKHKKVLFDKKGLEKCGDLWYNQNRM